LPPGNRRDTLAILYGGGTFEMAVINCPECGKEISDQEDRCLNCGWSPRPKQMPASAIGCLIIAGLLLIFVVIPKCLFVSSDPPPAGAGSQSWSTGINVPISRVFFRKQIRGCHQKRWRLAPDQKSMYIMEYIVQCAPDGKKYNVEYLVFPALDKVSGPYQPGGAK
jgi:hypothetical protein